jgi:hypothetical protein
MRICSVLSAQEGSLLIGLLWSSRWAQFIHHTDLSEPPWFSQIMIWWKDSNFIWSSHQVDASNIMDVHLVEEDNWLETKSKRLSSEKWPSSKLFLKSPRSFYKLKKKLKKRDKN